MLHSNDIGFSNRKILNVPDHIDNKTNSIYFYYIKYNLFYENHIYYENMQLF